MVKKYVVSGLLAALVLAGCSSNPIPVEPPAKLSAIENSLRINEKWHRDIGNGVAYQYLHFSPVWEKDKFYAVDFAGHLFVLNPANGHDIWRKKYKSRITVGLTATDERLYFATEKGQLVAVNKKDGSPIWQTQLTSEILTRPLVADKHVYVRSVDGKISKIDEANGKIIWVYSDYVPALTLRGNSQPVSYKDMIIIGSDDGKVFAINKQTGTKTWEKTIAIPKGRTEIERLVDLDASMLQVNDLLFLTSYQGRIACLHADTGRIIWIRDFSSYTGITAAVNKLFVSDSEGYVWALEPRSGATIWKQDKLLRRSITAPVVQDSHILVGDFNGFIHWLALEDGRIVARKRIADEDEQDIDQAVDLVFNKKHNFISPPMVNGNKIIATTRFGYTSQLVVN